MLNLFVPVLLIRKMKLFCSQSDSRTMINNTMCIKKIGEKEVEFAATDGQKLLVIRRGLDPTEIIDGEEFVIPIDNLPVKSKYLKYNLVVSIDTAAYNDGENVFKFPRMQGKFPDYAKLIEEVTATNKKADSYTAFRWENLKAAEKVLDGHIWDVPFTNNNAYLWKKHNGKEDITVMISSHLTND